MVGPPAMLPERESQLLLTSAKNYMPSSAKIYYFQLRATSKIHLVGFQRRNQRKQIKKFSLVYSASCHKHYISTIIESVGRHLLGKSVDG